VRWCPAAEVVQRQRQHGAILLDAREPPEFSEATLPGAKHLGQTSLMFHPAGQKAFIEELRAAAEHEIIIFGNTANPAGGTSGRDLWVLNYLWEVEGFALERLARLEGGVRQWSKEGRPLEPGLTEERRAELASREAARAYGDEESRVEQRLVTLLAGCGMEHLAATALCGVCVEACVGRFEAGGRPALLAWLQQAGCTLPERQKVASAIAKEARS